MSPQVNVSGQTLVSSQKQYVTRRFVGSVKLASSTFDVVCNTNALPDGCKVLKVVAKNLDGRSLTLTVPTNTALITSDTNGGTTAPFGGIKKMVSAPYTRFPTIKVQIPDLLAAPVDAANSTLPLFTVGSFLSGSTDTVQLTYTVRYAL